VGLNFFSKKQTFFKPEETEAIVEAIRMAERRTSGEIRVFVESRCPYMDAIDRAADIFFKLKMQQTQDRNAVILYVAIKDRQLAVLGDTGIHERVGSEYWAKEVELMIRSFNRENHAEGIRQCITDIGEALHTHFPYNGETDKNELPDEIVFGK
jgi:uncharacterized membrane protein